METKFTKGKWKVKPYSEPMTILLDTYIEIDSNKSALVFGHNDESIANAKLMAAAPLMYEKHDENDVFCGELIDMVKNNKLALDLLLKIKSNCCTAIQKATL